MSDSKHSTVSYTSISLDSDPSAWGIPLMDASEFPEMDPYKEVAQQGQAAPLSTAYVPDPMELEDHVPVYISEPAYPEYLVPSDDDIPLRGEETEPVKDERDPAATPPPPIYRTTSRMSVRSQVPIPFPSEAEIPSPPLPVPSLPTTSPTYAEAPLGYKAADISVSELSEERTWRHRDGHLEVIISVGLVYQSHVVDRRARSSIHDIRIYRGIVLLYVMRRRVRPRQEHLDSVKAHNKALEARIVVLETQAYHYEWQRQDADDHATGAMMHIQALEAGARIDTL
ncbi:hypothetical protein Tco_0194538 [Tanacetum coccineum]